MYHEGAFPLPSVQCQIKRKLHLVRGEATFILNETSCCYLGKYCFKIK